MEQNSTLVPESEVQSQKGCISCGHPIVLKGYPNALCADCRQKYIKYPIPLWVKAFGGGIALTIIILLFNMPKNLSTAIEYERAVKAEDARDYMTEQKALQHVVSTMPNYLEAKAHLLIAAYYNHDLKNFSAMAADLSGKHFDDEALMEKTNKVLDLADKYYPSDAFAALLKQDPDLSAESLPDTTYQKFIRQNPGDAFVQFLYASILDGRGQHGAADTMMMKILEKDPDYLPVLSYEAGLKRVIGDTKASMAYYDHLLTINAESNGAFAGKARTFLKLEQPKKAMEFALKAYSIDGTDGYTLATLIMAYHFNNMPKDRDALTEATKQGKDSSAKAYLKYALDVISKKDSL